MPGGHWLVLGSTCEVAGLHSRRGSRFRYSESSQSRSQRPRSALWTSSTLNDDLEARRSPLKTGNPSRHSPLPNQRRLFLQCVQGSSKNFTRLGSSTCCVANRSHARRCHIAAAVSLHTPLSDLSRRRLIS
ncbi:hypothetical protein ARMGADRAFT_301274 [Armillaria gallica]|uniref:Uncharacterized protein n=1 Tax=Armillaria gallica TaxID=47427 RepID=A0A2H3CCG1_ARMGA|nr:hypothetical protein ARMGADRAFT_301274 [Armillaria gallica]